MFDKIYRCNPRYDGKAVATMRREKK